MIHSGFALDYDSPPSIQRLALAVAGFGVALLLIFVGMGAFQPELGGQHVLLRQGSFLAAFAIILVAALQRRGLGALQAIPGGIVLLLGWCLASAMWSAQPVTVLGRAGFEIAVAAALFLGLDALGSERAFAIWRWLLAGVLLINFLSIVSIPVARQADGAWRGLYPDKDIAGAVCAMTAILFLFGRTGWRNFIGIAIGLAACVFLYRTHARGALDLLPPALAAGLIYRIGWRDGLSRTLLVIAATLLVMAAATFAAFDIGMIGHALEGNEFSGRAAAWTAGIGYFRGHPLLGAGLGGGPAGAGHNGYLQLLVWLGGIGGTIALMALLIQPLRRFWALAWDENGFKPMLFALFVFLMLHNLVEADFLAADNVSWAALLLTIAALMQRERHSSLLNPF